MASIAGGMYSFAQSDAMQAFGMRNQFVATSNGPSRKDLQNHSLLEFAFRVSHWIPVLNMITGACLLGSLAGRVANRESFGPEQWAALARGMLATSIIGGALVLPFLDISTTVIRFAH